MNFFAKDFRSKYLNYLFIMLLAIALYVGFDVLLDKVPTEMSKEAVVAAIGAIFVILSTKLLMERESENRLVEERRATVFKDNLADYRNAADKIIKILKDNEINPSELHEMREVHSKLILLGARDAIECSRAFISQCYEFLESDETDNETLSLSEKQVEVLWSLALNFLGSARSGLHVENDTFDIALEVDAFRTLNKSQSRVEKKYKARQELTGGVSEWVNINIVPKEIIDPVEKLIKILESSDLSLKSKCAKTQISFHNYRHQKKSNRVLYINGYNKRKHCLTLSLNSRSDKEYFTDASEKLKDFRAKLKGPKMKDGSYHVSFDVPIDSISHVGLQPLKYVIAEFIKRFH